MLCSGSARTLTGSYSASPHPIAGFNYPLRDGSEGTDREGRKEREGRDEKRRKRGAGERGGFGLCSPPPAKIPAGAYVHSTE